PPRKRGPIPRCRHSRKVAVQDTSGWIPASAGMTPSMLLLLGKNPDLSSTLPLAGRVREGVPPPHPTNLSRLSPTPSASCILLPSLPRGAACSDQWRKDGRAGGGRSFPGLAGWSAQVRRGAVSPMPHARNGVVAPRSKIPAPRGDVVSLIKYSEAAPPRGPAPLLSRR